MKVNNSFDYDSVVVSPVSPVGHDKARIRLEGLMTPTLEDTGANPDLSFSYSRLQEDNNTLKVPSKNNFPGIKKR